MNHITPDEQLVASSLAGDAAAFSELYTRYLTRIYQYHYFRTFHKETAEDLTSQTFIRGLEHLASYNEKKGSFSAWLYRIARNLLIDHARSKKPTLNLEDALDVLHDKTNLPKTADERALLARVQDHLTLLTPEQREVILLRLWDERSYAEIAIITGKSEASCKMTVSRALAILRKHLAVASFLLLVHLLSTYV